MRRLSTALCLLLLLLGLGVPSAARAEDEFGVLVMAHGGGEAWNREVEAMLKPLSQEFPLEIAFGMADPNSIQAAANRLEQNGVDRIGVIRLFISGESWRERTEQILSLRPGAPARPSGHDHAGAGEHGGHDMALWRIDSDARFAISMEGLAEAPEMGAVLAERASALSTDPARESVLVLAHGPGDDAENERWIAEIGERTDAVRALAPFRAVRAETLREDWPEKRAASEERIRAFVEEALRDDGRVLVIPYRVSGFGPYARVLEGLSYVADRRGLLPSDEVRQWVRRQAETLRAELTASAP